MITRHRLSADFGLDTIYKHKTYVVCRFMGIELIGIIQFLELSIGTLNDFSISRVNKILSSVDTIPRLSSHLIY